jgi:hypothetical protein
MLSRRKQSIVGLFFALSTFGFAIGLNPARAAENSPAPDRAYELGAIINFGASGDSDRFKVSGWSAKEKEFTWTLGKGGVLSVKVPAVDGALNLRAKLVGLIHPPELAYQPVEVYVNDEKVADWEVSTPADFMAIVPQKIAAAKNLKIELRTPKSTTPKAIHMNDDARVLGVACYEIQITKE